MYSDTFAGATFTEHKQGGFIPGGFNFGAPGNESFLANTGSALPALYSPYMAGTSGTHRRNCLPLQIGMIYKAYNENPSATRVVVHGEEVGHLKVVGRCHQMRRVTDGGSEKLVFQLEDDTGEITVEWLIGVVAEDNSPWLANELQKLQDEATSGVIYLKVWGECNLRGVHEPRVKANVVHKVKDFHEVELHKLDTIVYELSQPSNQLAPQLLQLRQNPTGPVSSGKVVDSSASGVSVRSALAGPAAMSFKPPVPQAHPVSVAPPESVSKQMGQTPVRKPIQSSVPPYVPTGGAGFLNDVGGSDTFANSAGGFMNRSAQGKGGFGRAGAFLPEANIQDGFAEQTNGNTATLGNLKSRTSNVFMPMTPQREAVEMGEESPEVDEEGDSPGMGMSVPTVGDIVDKVLSFLRQNIEKRPQGIHIRVIAQFLSVEVVEVQNALHELEDRGDAFYTRNEQMWSAVAK